MTGERAGPARGIAVFGGAFNPPHLTHRRIIHTALEQLPVARLIVMPAGAHPHKQDPDRPADALAPAADRLELCRLAFGDMPDVVIDDREVRRQGLAFTVDTLRELRAEHPDRELFFLVGSDNLPLLETWREPEAIRSLCTLVVYPRLGYPAEDTTAHPGCRLLAVEPDDVSATRIRSRLHAGQEPDDLDPKVLAAIRSRGLYRS